MNRAGMKRAPRTIIRHKARALRVAEARAARNSARRAGEDRAASAARLFDRADDIHGAAERSLRRRGLPPPYPPTVRSRVLLRGPGSAQAIVAAITPLNRPHNIVGLARHWLDSGEVDVYEAASTVEASTRGCGVLLAPIASTIVVGEQLIPTLLAARVTELPAVAAIEARLLATLELPAQVRRVLLAHDVNMSEASAEAALKLARRVGAFGVSVVLLPPPVGFETWAAFGRANAVRKQQRAEQRALLDDPNARQRIEAGRPALRTLDGGVQWP